MAGSIRERLARGGLAPSKARGQNFLRSANDARRIVECTGITAEDAVVEIGPGLGDLTRAIAAVARRTVALEVDAGLVRALAEADLPDSVEVRHEDVRRTDLGVLAQELGPRVVLIGNLPYVLSGRILGALLGPRIPFRRFGFMVQAEVADRVLAAPGGPDYGPLSVWATLWCRTERALEFGPDAFVPRPRVRSTFLVFEPDPGAPVIERPAVLRRLVRTAFQYRRKTLRAALRGRVEGAEQALELAGVDPGLRPQQLSPLDFVRLAQALPEPGPESPEAGRPRND